MLHFLCCTGHLNVYDLPLPITATSYCPLCYVCKECWKVGDCYAYCIGADEVLEVLKITRPGMGYREPSVQEPAFACAQESLQHLRKAAQEPQLYK